MQAISSKTLELSLPAPLAFPFARFNAERLPTDRLLAMADCLEAALRYLTFVAAADVMRQRPGASELDWFFDDSFHAAPMLGDWERAFRRTVEVLRRCDSAFVPELLDFEADPSFVQRLQNIRAHRNVKMHRPGSTARTTDESERLMSKAKPDFLLLIHRLAFLSRYELVAARSVTALEDSSYEVVRFMGSNVGSCWRTMIWTAPKQGDIPENKPLLCGAQGSGLLSLWPFVACELLDKLTVSQSLFVLAGIGASPEGFRPEKGQFLFASVRDRDYRSYGPSGGRRASRGEWLKAEASASAMVPQPIAESLYRDLVEHRPRWEGREVTGSRGSYRLCAQLAEGGQAAVYLAEGRGGEDLCVKFIRLGGRVDEKQLQRFQRQLEAFRCCGEHPHIVQIIDSGRCTSAEGLECFLVMERAQGGDLASRIRQWGPVGSAEEESPDIAARLQLFAEVVAATAHLHDQSIVHRDIKPGNVLLRADGTPLLSDLDLVRMVGKREAHEQLTSVGTPVGTPVYMAPEQREGREPTRATDVFALGLLLYELLMAEQALPGLQEVRADTISRFREAMGEDLAEVLDRCTRIFAAERFQDAAELLAKLSRLIENPPSVQLPARPSAPPRPSPQTPARPMSADTSVPTSSDTRHPEGPAGPAPRAAKSSAPLVDWDELPEREQKLVQRMLQLLTRGDVVRLNMAVRSVPSAARKVPLVASVKSFCQQAVKLKLDVTADNRAAILRGLDSCLAALHSAPGVYDRYSAQLREALLAFAAMMTSIARSKEMKRDILERIRRFAIDSGDDTLFRRLDEFE